VSDDVKPYVLIEVHGRLPMAIALCLAERIPLGLPANYARPTLEVASMTDRDSVRMYLRSPDGSTIAEWWVTTTWRDLPMPSATGLGIRAVLHR
jgi:hypothetical protein